MSILDAPPARVDGTDATLRDLTGGRVALLVDVASRCGLISQFSCLERLRLSRAEPAGRPGCRW